MSVSDSRLPDHAALRERIESEPVARLATVRPDGSAHVVPVCFAFDGDDIVSAVDDKPKSTRDLARLENVRTQPRASLLVDHYEDDWTKLWWVRVDTSAHVGDDPVRAERGIRALVDKYPQYRELRPGGRLLILTPLRWRSWSASP